jgi:hypothetical protein
MWLLTLLACQNPVPPSVDPSVPAARGQARAGWIEPGPGEAALFGGVTAEGKAGDIKLYNRLVQVVIQGVDEGSGYVNTSGGIIDLDLVRSDGALGRDLVEDLFVAFGYARLFDAELVEVVNDGTDGGSAVVRSRGRDVTWAFFQGLFELATPTVDDLHLAIEATYELPPESHTLTITITLTNTGLEPAVFIPQLGSMASGEELASWGPGVGLEGTPPGPLEAAIFAGRNHEATFSSWSDPPMSASGLGAATADLGIFLADGPPTTLEPGASTTITRWLAITPDPVSAEAERRRQSGQTLATVTGKVAQAGAGLAGVRVHLVDEAGKVGGYAVSGADGAWSASLSPGTWTAYAVAQTLDELVPLPPGAGRYGPFAAERVNQLHMDTIAGQTSVAGIPYAAGRLTPPPTTFTLPADGAVVDLEVPAAGGLRIELVDARGAPVPGVAELRWAAGAPPASVVPENLIGPLGIETSGRAAWAWTSTGVLDLEVAPGVYDLNVGHSWRHDRAVSSGVVVAEGERAVVRLVLDEILPRDAWLAVDPHLHGAPSFDGALPMEDRLITCAATGVELPVTTDHDAIADYRRLATALGLDARMRVIPGSEVTTLARGHFNLYPLQPAPLASPNGGAVRWWDPFDDTEALFARMREVVGADGIIQVNHPRTPGMFAFAALRGAVPGDLDRWSWNFETFELLNGGVDDFNDMRQDWFALLDAGQIRTPTGASDSHYRYIPCGMARTDVFLGSANVGDATPEDVRDAVKAGHVVVASGTTLRASATGAAGAPALPGDVVTGGQIAVHATVAAPAWFEPGTLRIYAGGTVVVEAHVPAGSGLRLDQTWSLDLAEDTWVVVEVEGSTPMGAAWRDALPYAAANAFRVDVAGDGWTAPGARLSPTGPPGAP